MTTPKSNAAAQAQSKHGPCRALTGPGRAFAAQDAPKHGQGTEASRWRLVAPATGKSAKRSTAERRPARCTGRPRTGFPCFLGPCEGFEPTISHLGG